MPRTAAMTRCPAAVVLSSPYLLSIIARYDLDGAMACVCVAWRREWQRRHMSTASPYAILHEPRRRANANVLIRHAESVAALPAMSRGSIVVLPSFGKKVCAMMYSHFGIKHFRGALDNFAHIYCHQHAKDLNGCRTITLSVWSKRINSTHQNVPMEEAGERLLRDYCEYHRFVTNFEPSTDASSLRPTQSVYVLDESGKLLLMGELSSGPSNHHLAVRVKRVNSNHPHIISCGNILGLDYHACWGSTRIVPATMDWKAAIAHYVPRAPRHPPLHSP